MTRHPALIAVFAAAAFCAQTLWSQTPSGQSAAPFDKDDLVRMLPVLRNAAPVNRAATEQTLAQLIRSRRVSFPASPETLQELQNAGASPAVLSAVTDVQMTAKDLFPAQSNRSRITKDTLLQVLKAIGRQKTPADRSYLEQGVIVYLRGLRTDFVVTSAVAEELRTAGAGAGLVDALRGIQLTANELLDAARADLQAGRIPKAVSEADLAVSLQPSLPAYQLQATAKARANDMEGSHAASLKAVAAGGELTIPVVLAAPGENFRKTCGANLTASKGRVTLAPNPGETACAAAAIRGAALLESGANQYVGKDRQAFHVLVQPEQGNRLNLSLAPAEPGGNKWALDLLAAAATR